MLNYSKINRISEIAVLSLLAFTILWKGGKTLDSTWLLLAIATGCWLALSVAEGFVVFSYSLRQKEHSTVWQWWLELIVVASILWVILSFSFSQTQNYGFDEVLRTAGLGLLFLWAMKRSGSGEPSSFEERFVRLLAILTILTCLIGVAVYLSQPVNRFVATFFDPRFHTDYWPNAAAQFLLLAWPVVLLQSISKNNEQRKTNPSTPLRAGNEKLLHWLITFFSTGFILGSLFLTYSRGAWLAFLGQLLLLFLLLFLRRKRAAPQWKPILLLFFSIALGIGVFRGVNHLRAFFHPVQSLEEKFTFSAAEGTSSISERSQFFTQAFSLSLKKPLLGWGPYSFRFVQPRLQESPLTTSDHPHNVFLKLSMEQGVSAALLFLGFIGIILYLGTLSVFSGKRLYSGDNYRLGSLLLLVSTAGVLAHNLIDYNLQFVGIALPFFLMMGMLQKMENGKLRMENGNRTKFSILHYQFSILLVIVPLLFFLSIREGYFLVTSSFGRHSEARGEAQHALSWYNRSRGTLFPRDLELSRAHLLAATGNFEEAEEALRSYIAKNAEDSRAWNQLGSLLLALENYPEAIDTLKQAFAYGSWNDLSISRHLLEALLAETYAQPTTDAAADSTHLLPHPDLAIYVPEIEKRVLAFVDAIRRNTHFTALSPNPEEAKKALLMLSILSPERTEEFRSLDKIIQAESDEERLRTRARPPGWLW